MPQQKRPYADEVPAPSYQSILNAFADDLASATAHARADRNVRHKAVVQADSTRDSSSSASEPVAMAMAAEEPSPMIRKLVQASKLSTHPNSDIIFRSLIVQAGGRDGVNPMMSMPMSSNNGYTTSHGAGPGGVWKSLYEDSGGDVFERLAPFFGLPTRPVARDPYLSQAVDVWDLPKAYEGENRYLSQILFNQLVETDLAILRFGLPPTRIDSTAPIVLTRFTYDPAMLSRTPYESAVRLVTSRRDTREFRHYRFGLGAMSEWGFWNHPEGQMDWLRKQDQIAYAVQRTAALQAVIALLHCIKVPAGLQEASALPHNATSWREAIKHELNMWNIIPSHYDGLQELADSAREELAARRVTVSPGKLMLVVPNGTDKFVTRAPEHRLYLETGKPRETYDDPSSVSVRGIGRLHVSRPFMTGIGERPIDPMYRLRAIGYQWFSTGLPSCSDLDAMLEFKTPCGDTEAHFEEPSDDFGAHPTRALFKNCGLYRTDSVEAKFAPEKLGAPHPNTVFAAGLLSTLLGKTIHANMDSLNGVKIADLLGATDNGKQNMRLVGRFAAKALATDPEAFESLKKICAIVSAANLVQAQVVAEIAAKKVVGFDKASIAAAVAAAKGVPPAKVEAGWARIALALTGVVLGSAAAVAAVSELSAGFKEILEGTSVFGDDGRGYQLFMWMFDYNVPVPARIEIAAPHVVYEVGQGILLVGGGEAGITIVGNPDALVGMNPKTKIVSLSFTINMGAQVINPDKVVVIPNVMVRRYIGGCKMGNYFNASSSDDLKHYKAGTRGKQKDLFCILCPNDYTPGFCTSTTGVYNPAFTTSDELKCPTMGLYATMYGWQNQAYNVFDYNHNNPVQWRSTLLFQQLQFNHAVGPTGKCERRGAITADRGHWQSGVTDTGCLKYRCGHTPTPPNFVPTWRGGVGIPQRNIVVTRN